jgi:hypothetical protein
MEIANYVLCVVAGGVLASIYWIYTFATYPSEVEQQWLESRQILLDKIEEQKRHLVIAYDELATAQNAKHDAQAKVDELRDALYRVYDVARCWDDNPEA